MVEKEMLSATVVVPPDRRQQLKSASVEAPEAQEGSHSDCDRRGRTRSSPNITSSGNAGSVGTMTTTTTTTTTTMSGAHTEESNAEKGESMTVVSVCGSQDRCERPSSPGEKPLPVAYVRSEHRPPLVRTWPSVLMRLMSESSDDEWSPVMERIRTHPQEIPVKGVNGGMNCLHAAAVRYPPSHVIRALLDACPEAGLVQNYNGETPLHLACFSASEHAQEILIRAAPQAAKLRDQYGDCPLHLAARAGATLPLMELFLKAAPEAVSIPNNRGVTPLWLLPRSYLEVEDFNELMEEDDEDLNYMDDWNRTVLFLRYSYFGASSCSSSTAMVQAGDTDQDYSWVVHAAASTPGCPREVLKFLFRSFPDQALKYNEQGLTPLILATHTEERDEPRSWDEHEDGFREEVDIFEGEIRNADHAVIPEEAQATTAADVEFIYTVVQNQDRQEEGDAQETVMDILLEWSEISASYPDKQGRLPLAHALMHGRSFESVRRLIAAWPRAVEAQDPVTGMHMFELAATSSPDLGTVYTLVRGLPEVIRTLQFQAPPRSRAATEEKREGDVQPPRKRPRL